MNELNLLREQNAALLKKIASLELEPYLTKSGVKFEAVDYVLHRLREHYDVSERGVTAQIPGTVPVSWHRWLQGPRQTEPHLFGHQRMANQEGKSSGNPWAKASWNLTQQALLTRRDPSLADWIPGPTSLWVLPRDSVSTPTPFTLRLVINSSAASGLNPGKS
jgi:hypothetical protein